MERTSMLYVFAEHQASPDELPPTVFYALCNSEYADCVVNIYADPVSQGMTELVGELPGNGVRKGEFRHDPSKCANPQTCMYIFVIKNTHENYKTISLRVKSQSFDPGDVDLTKSYQNSVNYNEFVTYEINPQSNFKI